MSLWRAVELAVTSTILVLGAMFWRKHWLAKEAEHDAHIDALIARKGRRELFPVLTPADQEAMRKKAALRRARVDEKQSEGAKIASGEPDRSIKLVGRR